MPPPPYYSLACFFVSQMSSLFSLPPLSLFCIFIIQKERATQYAKKGPKKVNWISTEGGGVLVCTCLCMWMLSLHICSVVVFLACVFVCYHISFPGQISVDSISSYMRPSEAFLIFWYRLIQKYRGKKIKF